MLNDDKDKANFTEGLSGNLTLAISEYLAQFFIIQEETYKIPLTSNIYIKGILKVLTGLAFYLIS